MTLVIKLDDETYKEVMNRTEFDTLLLGIKLIEAAQNGAPLPRGHGRLIDKDHMIARLEAASKFYGGENTDAFDERFSYGLKEAAIKVAEEPTIIEADEFEGEG